MITLSIPIGPVGIQRLDVFALSELDSTLETNRFIRRIPYPNKGGNWDLTKLAAYIW